MSGFPLCDLVATRCNGRMQRYELNGFEIVVMGGRWELFDDDGNLLADGRGGTDKAFEWIARRAELVREQWRAAQVLRH